MINRLISAIDASASPRNPSVPMRNKSSASTILLVACGATASGNSFGGNPVAVVDHAHQFDSALPHRHVDPRRSGIDRIFEQFFHHAGRPLNHLAGRDFIDNARR